MWLQEIAWTPPWKHEGPITAGGWCGSYGRYESRPQRQYSLSGKRRKRTKHKFLFVTIPPAEWVASAHFAPRDFKFLPVSEESEKWTSCPRTPTSCCRQLISPASMKSTPAQETALPSKTTTTTSTRPSLVSSLWIYLKGCKIWRKGPAGCRECCFFLFMQVIFYEPPFTFAPPTAACCNTVLFI